MSRRQCPFGRVIQNYPLIFSSIRDAFLGTPWRFSLLIYPLHANNYGRKSILISHIWERRNKSRWKIAASATAFLWQSANKLLDFLNWGNFLPLFHSNVHQCPSIVEAAFAIWLIWECCETPGHFCLVISLHTNHAWSRISLSVWWLTWCLQQYLWYYYYHSQTFVRVTPHTDG